MNNSKLFTRIQVRAYYIWLNEFTHHEKHIDGADVKAWLAAERIELALQAKRKAAAFKGAQTRAAKRPIHPSELSFEAAERLAYRDTYLN